MGRLIDADRLKAHYCWWAGGSKEMSIDEAKKTFDTIIDVQPTVDAEPVVRCKNCKWFDPNGYYGANCAKWSELFIYYEERLPIDENGYCHMGERYE